MRTTFFIIAINLFANIINSQSTSIPDPNFEQALIDSGIDSDGTINGQVLTADISSKNILFLYSKGISTLTGIEDFSSLTNLYVDDNNIAMVDLSMNLNLIEVSISNSQLTSITLPNTSSLTSLILSFNSLSNIDLSNAASIEGLSLDNNQFSSIDVSQLNSLTLLDISYNNINSLSITSNTLLTDLYVSNNQLTNFPNGLENLNNLIMWDLGFNQIGGCWPQNLSNLCQQSPLSLAGNMYDGINNFISDQGYYDFCNSQFGQCPCLHPDYPALEEFYNSLGGDNWTNNEGWLEDCDPCGIEDGTPWHGIRCFGTNTVIEVSLGLNNAVGCIPAEIRDLVALETLSLVGSDLSGCTIPEEIAELFNLRNLNLEGCQLSGEIPEFICNLVGLESFAVGINQLTGEIPACFSDFLFLEIFSVRDNQFTGSLPNFNGDQENLDQLILYNNNFTGSIPASYGDLTLSTIGVQNNNLSGDYASELGALCALGYTNANISNGNSFNEPWEDFCTVPCAFVPDDNFELALQALGYDSGPLDDCVPISLVETVTVLDVSGQGIEDLTGIEFFTALENLDCSNNEIVFINLNDNTALTCLNASDNMINCLNLGFDNLTNMNELNVANNNIAGCWPEEMQDLCGLASYDFSGNFYDGIDNFISNAGWMNYCNGNVGACSGSWDGWTNLGQGLNGAVNAMTTDAAGNLYVGGYFNQAGGQSANRVAKWDGTSWTNLGQGVNSYVPAMTTDAAGNLYIGGLFTQAGGQSVSRVAKWDGTSWTNLGQGLNWHVYAMTTDAAGNLYVGGGFNQAGGQSANGVAKWDGTSWTNLGQGVNGRVHGMTTDAAGNLYVGGYFTQAGGQSANRVAKYQLCEPEMIITCEIPEGSYIAGQQIQTTAPVINLDDVTLSAPEVIMNPGFSVQSGSLFEANNDGCN